MSSISRLEALKWYNSFSPEEQQLLLRACGLTVDIDDATVADVQYAHDSWLLEQTEGCPRCGSYEGDHQECPECGYGQ